MTVNEIAECAIRIAPTFVVGIGVFVPWQGLKTWRRQIHGQLNVELARQIARRVYLVRDLAVELHRDLTDKDIPIRLNIILPVLAELRAFGLEAQVVWQDGIGQAVDDVYRECGSVMGQTFNQMEASAPLQRPNHAILDAKIDAVIKIIRNRLPKLA